MHKEVIGVIGFGTVGSGVVKGINLNGQLIGKNTGIDIHIKTIADIDTSTDRGVDISTSKLTDKYEDILNDDEIEIVVQLIGGTDAAFDIMMKLLEKGKKVVTANKALLALKGPALFQAAKKNNTTIAFEASTAGGIPILAAIRDGLAGNAINSFYGIVNGTSNYILTQMTYKECSYENALDDAREKGYAEADPSFDVKGIDSAHKLIILTAIGFQSIVSMENVFIEGITHIDKTDINFARELGYTVKSLAIGIKNEQGLELRVHPTLLPNSHPLASVNGVFNAICLNGNLVGETMFYGQGAGSLPTASAVIADIVDTALGRYEQRFKNLCYFKENSTINIIPFSEYISKFYVRFMVKDLAGVLAKITSILSHNNISIASMIQKPSISGETGIEIMTHKCVEKDFNHAIEETKKLDFITKSPAFIRALDLGFENL